MHGVSKDLNLNYQRANACISRVAGRQYVCRGGANGLARGSRSRVEGPVCDYNVNIKIATGSISSPDIAVTIEAAAAVANQSSLSSKSGVYHLYKLRAG